MKKKLCLVYANCQGRGIETFLNKAAEFRDQFNIHRLDVVDHVKQGIPVPEDVFSKADIFIHQPIKDIHGKSSTDYLKKFLPAHCEIFSFPYIYNSALWPMYSEAGEVIGKESVLDLFSRGCSLEKVVEMLFNQQIDFRFSERFEKSVAILRDKEAETNIRVSDFILANIRTRKLFLTQNHPTSAVFIHCVNQINDMLGLPRVLDSEDIMPNETGLPDCWPASPYEVEFYGYEYRNDWRPLHREKMDSNWKRFYARLIGAVHELGGLSTIWDRLYVKVLSKTTLIGNSGYL